MLALLEKFRLLDWKHYLQRFVAAERDGDLLQLSTVHEMYLLLLAGLERPTPSQVAETLHVTRPAVSAMVRKLAAPQFIQKVGDPADRRTYRIHLGPKGQELYNIDERYYLAIFARVYERLSDAERQALRRVMEVAVDVMMECPAASP